MIIDTIENLGKYVTLNPLFADVVEFLKNNDLQTIEEGKHFIKDKDLFVNIAHFSVLSADTKMEPAYICTQTPSSPGYGMTR